MYSYHVLKKNTSNRGTLIPDPQHVRQTDTRSIACTTDRCRTKKYIRDYILIPICRKNSFISAVSHTSLLNSCKSAQSLRISMHSFTHHRHQRRPQLTPKIDTLKQLTLRRRRRSQTTLFDTLKQLTMPTLKQLTSPTQTPLLAIADAIAVELNHFNDSDDIANTRKPVWI